MDGSRRGGEVPGVPVLVLLFLYLCCRIDSALQLHANRCPAQRLVGKDHKDGLSWVVNGF